MEFDPLAIGARISHARAARGLTQEELAGMSSFSYRSLQEWERGVRVPFKQITELAKHLDTTRDWLLYGDDEGRENNYTKLLRRMDEIEAQTQETLGLVRDLLGQLPQPSDESPEDAER